MSKSSEAAMQQEDERENLSGMEMTAYMACQHMRVETICDLAGDKNKQLKEFEE